MSGGTSSPLRDVSKLPPFKVIPAVYRSSVYISLYMNSSELFTYLACDNSRKAMGNIAASPLLNNHALILICVLCLIKTPVGHGSIRALTNGGHISTADVAMWFVIEKQIGEMPNARDACRSPLLRSSCQ